MSNQEFVAENGIIVGGNAHLRLPQGNTGQRPVNAGPGSMRYNTDLDVIEVFYANGTFGPPTATSIGANPTFSGSVTVGNSTANVFTNSTVLVIGANVSVNSSAVRVGNVVHGTATISVGANVNINATAVGVGNSTVSVIITGSSINAGSTGINSSSVTVGGGASLNSTAYTGTAMQANNSAYLGGVVATQYAFANQVPSATPPGGSNTQIQINTNGVFSGYPGLTFNFNSNTVTIGAGTLSGTSYSGTANNASFLGGTAAASYVTTSGLPTAVSGLSVNNAVNLNSQAASYYLNRANHTGVEGTGSLSSSVNYVGNIFQAATYLYSSGNVYAVGDVYAAYCDVRFKEGLQPITGALDTVCSLNGKSYYQNELGFKMTGIKREGRSYGLIAQEVQAVIPEIVGLAACDMDEDEVTSKSGENYLTYAPEKLIPFLVEAIKELRAEIEGLKRPSTRFGPGG